MEVIPVPDSLGKEAYIGVCISRVYLNRHCVLISATPLWGDKVICRNSGLTFQTFVQKYEPIIIPPFLEGFPF